MKFTKNSKAKIKTCWHSSQLISPYSDTSSNVALQTQNFWPRRLRPGDDIGVLDCPDIIFGDAAMGDIGSREGD